VRYICYGRLGEGDVYAVAVTKGGKVLREAACVFSGEEVLVIDTDELKVSIKRKKG
jgi:hypothetical protein